jgi:hypothetical protein
LRQSGNLFEGLLQQFGHETTLPDGPPLRNAARWNAPWVTKAEKPQILKTGSARVAHALSFMDAPRRSRHAIRGKRDGRRHRQRCRRYQPVLGAGEAHGILARRAISGPICWKCLTFQV